MGPPPVATMTSGMSHKFTSPSLLSSVKFATSGVTMLPWMTLPVAGGASHVHFTFGSNEFGGCGGAVHVGALSPVPSGGTWHLSTGGPLPSPKLAVGREAAVETEAAVDVATAVAGVARTEFVR